jgi:hypothetical protein
LGAGAAWACAMDGMAIDSAIAAKIFFMSFSVKSNGCVDFTQLGGVG